MPPRKPNYKFERMERDRAKAAKKDAKARAKAKEKDVGADDVEAENGDEDKAARPET